MERPGERIRLKDRIIDNISKSIKSIQELVYYQYKDSTLVGYDDGVVLYGNNHMCHKLCENLDHTLLHGLKHVIRGYWRVVKQLSPHAMVREIEMLVNVTTDLGRGRAWLYASLNEGLLESYIRLLCDNEKLLKKYYAKEALVLDKDRMSVLLTLASGLDYVTFRLEYDVPYLDLNAYPPRSRRSSDQETYTSSDSSDSCRGQPTRYRSKSEVFANLPVSTFGMSSDSDSQSLASLDAHSHTDHMKSSTISADSGFPADGNFTNGTGKHSETSSETVLTSNNASASSLTSLGDQDKHQRLESVVPSGGNKNKEDELLEVIRIKNKKGNSGNFKKKSGDKDNLSKKSKGSLSALIPVEIHNDLSCREVVKNSCKDISCTGTRSVKSSVRYVVDKIVIARSSVINYGSCDGSLTEYPHAGHESNLDHGVSEPAFHCDSGVDLHCLSTVPLGKSSVTGNHSSINSDLTTGFCVKNSDFTLSGSAHISRSLEPASATTCLGPVKTSLGSSVTSAGSRSVMPSLGLETVQLSAISGSAVMSACSGSVVMSACSGSAVTIAGSESVVTLAGSDPVKESNRSKHVITSIKQEVNEPCYLDIAGSESNQDLICTQMKSHLIPSHAVVATNSSSSLFINNQHSKPTDDRNTSCSSSAVSISFDTTKYLNNILNPRTHILTNQNKVDPNSSNQRWPDEPPSSLKQYKGSTSEPQIMHRSRKTISLDESKEPEGLVFPLDDDDDADDVYASNNPEKIHNLPKLPKKALERTNINQTEHGKDSIDQVSDSLQDSPQGDGNQQASETKDTDLALRLKKRKQVSSSLFLIHHHGCHWDTLDDIFTIFLRPSRSSFLGIDNNTVLEMMLNVFSREDEKFVKMFVTWKDHTEGNPGVAYLLISDQCLYILQYQRATKKFVRQSCTQLTDIIFISTGLNGQTLNIESRGKGKQKQRLWLSPGHNSLTQAILACLADAVKTANEHVSGKSRFSVGSEVPLQKIALRKYVSGELGCKPQDVSLWDYSLVFWEDSSSGSTRSNSTMYKEGVLLLSSSDSIRGHIWKPVFVILKNSMLYIKNNKQDPRCHSYLSLAGDQCVGCRITSHAGQDNCVELILSSRGSWVLSAASKTEISEWGHSLCLAVSQGSMDINTLAFCVPCCAVMSCHSLFLCHEDLYTKFYRTLGRCHLKDVTSVLVDGGDSSYCIINLRPAKANDPSCQWVLYFNSSEDLERHKTAFSSAWKDIHKAELPILPVDDLALQFYCRTNITHLRQHLTQS